MDDTVFREIFPEYCVFYMNRLWPYLVLYDKITYNYTIILLSGVFCVCILNRY